MSRLAIMQGRLVPAEVPGTPFFPRQQWKSEFSLAAEAGLNAIEWIYDAYGDGANPISTDAGISEMKALSLQHGIAILSLCANYVMDRPIIGPHAGKPADLLERLEWLLARCRKIGIERIVLPFLDQSGIEDHADESQVVSLLRGVLPKAQENSVELHLETSLAPARLAALIAQLPHPLLKVAYDSGNSASFGYSPREELSAVGGRIGSVHIKDRARGGGSVPLGKGSTNFAEVFQELATLGFAGDYVLEVARSEPGQEVNWARQNRTFVVDHLRRASNSRSQLPM